MEERAVLANIASIITKDLLIDQPPVDINSGSYPLLSFGEDDDEAEIFALMQRKRAMAASRKRRMLREPEVRKQDLKVPKLEWLHAELNLLHRYTDAQFESYLHMRKLTFLVSLGWGSPEVSIKIDRLTDLLFLAGKRNHYKNLDYDDPIGPKYNDNGSDFKNRFLKYFRFP